MATDRRPFLRLYDLEFDQIALDPKLTHEEKVRLLVLLRHLWTNGERSFFDSFPLGEELNNEIAAFRDEIEKRMAA